MARLCSRNFWRLWFATRSGFNRLAHSQRALKIHRETSNWVADSTFTFKPLNSFWTCSLSCLHSARGRQAAALRARALGVSLSLSPGHGGWSKPPGIMPTRSGCALVPSISLSLSRRPRIAPCVVNSHEISVVRALPAALPAALEHAADRHPHNTSTRFQANYHLDRFRKSAASSSLLPVSTCSRNSSNNGAVPGLCFHCERAC